MKHFKSIIITVLTLLLLCFMNDDMASKFRTPDAGVVEPALLVGLQSESPADESVNQGVDEKEPIIQDPFIKSGLRIPPLASSNIDPPPIRNACLKLSENEKHHEKEHTDETELKIVQIALMDEGRGLGGFVCIPEPLHDLRETTQKIRISGNDSNVPLTLYVNTAYADGAECYQILDWDAQNPNVFALYNPLGVETIITAWHGNKRVGWFSGDAIHVDAVVELSLNQDKSMQLAATF